jgi:hypothetical protein
MERCATVASRQHASPRRQQPSNIKRFYLLRRAGRGGCFATAPATQQLRPRILLYEHHFSGRLRALAAS